jgi:hypothetical protein
MGLIVKGPPDATKMKELILHVAAACAHDPLCGAVKFDKILFYSDFLAYLKLGRSITGQPYFAIKNGPAPQQFVPIREEMMRAGDIEIEETPIPGLEHPFVRIVAKRRPDYSVLSPEEIEIVAEVIIKTKKLTGTNLSAKSHLFKGWELAWKKGPKTLISFASVLFDTEGFWGLPTPELPREQVEYGRALWKKIAAA